MNNDIKKLKKWIEEHKVALLLGAGGLALAVGIGVGHKRRVNRKIDVKVINGPADPFINLVPPKWNAGTLHSLQWSKEDSLICIENLTADKMGVLGEDLLGCAMKEGESVDAILHIFYNNSQE